MNIFISGASGRMGQEIKNEIDGNPNFSFAGGMNQDHQDEISTKPDVVIDFSLPQAIPQVVQFCQTNKVPLVSGTTGLSPEDNSLLIGLSKELPVFWAANMSFGVFIMSELIKKMGRLNGPYKYKISETHHTKKVDAPSGTAIMLEKSAKSAGLQLEPTESIRQGEVFGIHSFYAEGAQEKIEIRHEAFSRALFAQGALQVAQWLVQQGPGFYNMADFFDH